MITETKYSNIWIALLIIVIFVSLGSCATANLPKGNIHLIDEHPDTGYKIYRSGKPSAEVMKIYCELGIDEMMVLSGNAEDHEYKLQNYCPSLKVIYNTKHKSKTPLTKSFLKDFDQWVMNAKKEGKIIAIRCDCGCHRSGRLAAYYQMKYNHLTSEDAKVIMTAHGSWMFYYPHLYPQVDALHDYINNRPCSVSAKYCVQDE